MKNIIIFAFLTIMVSCRNEVAKTINKSELITKTYYTNGNLKSEGALLSKNQPIGEWAYYDSTGVLIRKAEYLKINGKSFINQDWYFKSNGDTISNKGSHYEIYYLADTIKINEPVKAKVDLTAPLFRNENSEILIILPKDYSINFNEDFSNLKEVDLDTTFNLNMEKEMREDLELSTNFGKSAVFGRYYNSTGHKKFRGIIVEYFQKETTTFDSIKANFFDKYGLKITHTHSDSVSTDSMKVNLVKIHKYFEKDIVVIDSI